MDEVQHPSLDRVLLAREHELPPEEAAAILAHVDRCARCQAELKDLDVLGDISRSQGTSGDRDLARFHAQLQHVDVDGRARGLGRGRADDANEQVRAPFYARLHLIGAAAAVILLVIALPYLRSPRSDVLVAAELLNTLSNREAADVSNASPTSVSVSIEPVARTASGALFAGRTDEGPCRSSWSAERDGDRGADASGGSGTGTATAAGTATTTANRPATGIAALPAEVRTLLGTHCFDPRQPLRIAGYRRWYGALGRKADEVRADGDRTAITVSTEEGLIRKATLLVDVTASRPLALSLALADGAMLRFQASSEPLLTAPGLTPAPGPGLTKADAGVRDRDDSTASGRPAVRAAGGPTVAERLDLLSTLHAHRLDMGGVYVRRARDGAIDLVVDAQQVKGNRSALLREIGRVPSVRATFDAPARTPAIPAIPATPDEVVVAAPAPALADESIKASHTTPEEQRAFKNRLFVLGRTLSSRVNAIALALDLVTDADAAQLSRERRAEHHAIVESHRQIALETIARLEAEMSPIERSGGASDASAASGATAASAGAASTVAGSTAACASPADSRALARKVEVLVASLTGTLATGFDAGEPHQTASPRDADTAFPELRQTLRALQDCLRERKS